MQLAAESADRGKRLDQFIHARLPAYSRARIQDWIKSGRVRIGGRAHKASYELRGDERVDVEPAPLPSLQATPEDIPLEILYSDADVIAIDKPSGRIVHAGAGQHAGTLVNALLHHFGRLSSAGGDERPGIVHRLDRETSGVLLVARTDAAHRSLAEQFASRTVEKSYWALVEGRLQRETGSVEKRIARDPVRRTRMTTRTSQGRAAHTEYRVLERFPRHTYVEVRIGTGRTHQIRVHMASMGHPVAGDRLYGAAAAGYGRFFLHAHRLAFTSPSTGARITIESPLAPELAKWLGVLRGT